MDDKELVRKVAEVVMGWVWIEEHEMYVLDSERDANGRLTYCSPNFLDLEWTENIGRQFTGYKQQAFNPHLQPKPHLHGGGEDEGGGVDV